MIVAIGVGLVVMEFASKVTGQYFQFDYNQVPEKAKAVFGAAAADPRNAAPDRYAYQPLYRPTGAGLNPNASAAMVAPPAAQQYFA